MAERREAIELSKGVVAEEWEAPPRLSGAIGGSGRIATDWLMGAGRPHRLDADVLGQPGLQA
jgi:hypothetical protein